MPEPCARVKSGVRLSTTSAAETSAETRSETRSRTRLGPAFTSASRIAPKTAAESREATALETASTIRPNTAFLIDFGIRAESASESAFVTRLTTGTESDWGSHSPSQFRGATCLDAPRLTRFRAWDSTPNPRLASVMLCACTHAALHSFRGLAAGEAASLTSDTAVGSMSR